MSEGDAVRTLFWMRRGLHEEVRTVVLDLDDRRDVGVVDNLKVREVVRKDIGPHIETNLLRDGKVGVADPVEEEDTAAGLSKSRDLDPSCQLRRWIAQTERLAMAFCCIPVDEN